MHLVRTLGVLLSLATVGSFSAVGCRQAAGEDDSSRNVVDRQDGPQGTYKVVPTPDEASDAEKGAMAGGAGPMHRVIFLNKSGGTFTPGYDDSSSNKSSVLSAKAKIPAFAKGDASWKKLLSCVRGKLEKYDVDVTDKDPKAAPHIEVVVGGTSADVGMSVATAGFAPMNADCSPVERGVAYVFSATLDDDQLCAAATQEVGNVLGLDHVMLCDDAMSWSKDCKEKSFVDEDAMCGEYKSRSCICGGATQNSSKKLAKILGWKPTAPLVPDGGAPTPPGKSDGGAPAPPGKSDGGVTPDPPDDGGAPEPPSDAGPPADDGGAPEPPDDGGAPEPPKPGDDTTPPAIASLTPADGATLPANTTIDVSATIDDPSGISAAILRWTIGTKTVDWKCGDFTGEVTCEKKGGLYVWHVPVGSGTRQWAIRAVDGKGNEVTTTTRTITLSGSSPTPTPPPPPSACSVSFVSPADGDSISPGAHFDVRVTVSCSASAVRLIWRSPGGDMPYDLESSGSDWSIGLDLSPSAKAGTRDLLVTATGSDGKTYTAKRTINVSP